MSKTNNEEAVRWAVVHSDSRMEISRHDTYQDAVKTKEFYESIDRGEGAVNEYDIIPVGDE